MPTRKVILRWSAAYETEIDVPLNAPLNGIRVAWTGTASDIKVLGSVYQAGTWKVEGIREFGDSEIKDKFMRPKNIFMRFFKWFFAWEREDNRLR